MEMTTADYLRHAYAVAKHSKDQSTQNGAVLIPAASGLVVNACNDIPVGVSDTQERRERPLKYAFTEHAERGCIYLAARHGVKTEGATLYACWLACADCGRAIIGAGIKKVVRHVIPQHAGNERWKESIAAADQMFKEAGVEVEEFTGHLGVTVLFNGEEIEV